MCPDDVPEVLFDAACLILRRESDAKTSVRLGRDLIDDDHVHVVIGALLHVLEVDAKTGEVAAPVDRGIVVGAGGAGGITMVST